MWEGYEPSLAEYGRVVCVEWRRRGYKDTLLPTFEPLSDARLKPDWLGDMRLHISHQSNLIRKDKEFYTPKFPGVPDNLPYHWVTKEGK
jgi:hypothetical protein